MYYNAEFEVNEPTSYNKGLLNQLRWLKIQIHAGEADRMQEIYPEGFVFLASLYGLSWCNFILGHDKESMLYLEAEEEIRLAISMINSEKAQLSFHANLPLQFGAFYTGWNNYLIGKYLSIEKDSTLSRVFQSNCESIATALENSDGTFLESYSNMYWPADMFPCMVSLEIHDQLFEEKYNNLIEKWIYKLKVSKDKYGLIPHAVFEPNGTIRASARGSSQSLMLLFLHELDKEFGSQQFIAYKEIFLCHRFGLPGIREYPKGVEGNGDIDSGPVIFGIGGAASIVGMRTMAIYGREDIAIAIRNSIEAFGIVSTFNGKKRYIFGQLPIADAFIAWSNSIEPTKDSKLTTDQYWRVKFQLYSAVLLLALFILFKTIFSKQKKS